MEGKRVNGYPVFGGHWRLPHVIRKYKIEQILISNGNIQPEAFTRLMEFAEGHKIVVRRSKVLMEEIQTTPPVGTHHRPLTIDGEETSRISEPQVHQDEAG